MNQNTKIGFLVFCLTTLGCFSPSQDQVDLAVQKEMQKRDEEKKRIYSIIDEYMREKRGEILPKDDQDRPSIDEKLRHPKRVDLGDSPIKGYKSAKVTIFYFSDFQCSYCLKENKVLEEVMKKYAGNVKLVYKFFPLPIHPEAKLAAQAAVAAQKQGKFWEMHDLMYSRQTELQEEKLIEYAKSLGMDEQKFKKDLESPKTIQRVEAEAKAASQLGFTKTPSFVINGVDIQGVASLEDFSRIIDRILND